MVRQPRSALPASGIYHVNARGVEQRPIYGDDADRQFFLALMHHAARRYEWEILVYCLMTNHFHVVIEATLDRLSRGMHLLGARYAQAFNDRYARSGHLFQGRFHARAVEDETYRDVVCAYVLDNPIRAGICRSREEWPWLGGSCYAV